MDQVVQGRVDSNFDEDEYLKASKWETFSLPTELSGQKPPEKQDLNEGTSYFTECLDDKFQDSALSDALSLISKFLLQLKLSEHSFPETLPRIKKGKQKSGREFHAPDSERKTIRSFDSVSGSSSTHFGSYSDEVACQIKNMRIESDQNPEQLKKSIRDNLKLFVLCQEAIRKLSEGVKDENFKSKCEDLTLSAEALSVSIDQFRTAFKPIFSAKEEINTIMSTIEIQGKYKHIFDLPDHLNRLLVSSNFSGIVEEFLKFKEISKNLAIEPFFNVFEDCKVVFEDARTALFRLLENPCFDMDKIRPITKHLKDLEATTDPNLFYLKAQASNFASILEKFRPKHLKDDISHKISETPFMNGNQMANLLNSLAFFDNRECPDILPCDHDRFAKECLTRTNTVSIVCKFSLAFILEYSSASRVILADLEKSTKSSSKSSIPVYFHDYNEMFNTIAQRFASLITSLISEDYFISLFNHSTSAIPFCYLGFETFNCISTVCTASKEANLPSNFLASIYDFKSGIKNFIKAKTLDLCRTESRHFWHYESFQFSATDNHCTNLPSLYSNYLVFIMKCLAQLGEYNQTNQSSKEVIFEMQNNFAPLLDEFIEGFHDLIEKDDLSLYLQTFKVSKGQSVQFDISKRTSLALLHLCNMRQLADVMLPNRLLLTLNGKRSYLYGGDNSSTVDILHKLRTSSLHSYVDIVMKNFSDLQKLHLEHIFGKTVREVLFPNEPSFQLDEIIIRLVEIHSETRLYAPPHQFDIFQQISTRIVDDYLRQLKDYDPTDRNTEIQLLHLILNDYFNDKIETSYGKLLQFRNFRKDGSTQNFNGDSSSNVTIPSKLNLTPEELQEIRQLLVQCYEESSNVYDCFLVNSHDDLSSKLDFSVFRCNKL